MNNILSEEVKQKIISCFLECPKSMSCVSKETGYSPYIVRKALKEIPKYTRSKIFSPDLREDYFESIDSEEKAYFLGLIITDGCICKPTKHGEEILSLTLVEEDKYLLDEFIKELKSNKVSTPDGRGCYSINILSNKLCDSLKKYGITERKSLNTVFPLMDEKFMPHLIRGMFDGDGSISFYQRKDRNVHKKAIRMCQGNKRFLEDFINYMFVTFNIEKVSLFQEKENLWSFAYTANESLTKIIDVVYNNSKIFMKRKMEKIELIKKEIEYYSKIQEE